MINPIPATFKMTLVGFKSNTLPVICPNISLIYQICLFFSFCYISTMPITASAKKALRSSKRKRVFNLNRKETMKGVIKEYKKLIDQKKTAEAQKLVPKLQKAIDKAMKKGVIKKNTASRKKSRLMKKLSK